MVHRQVVLVMPNIPALIIKNAALWAIASMIPAHAVLAAF
jgi:hypothetical protein